MARAQPKFPEDRPLQWQDISSEGRKQTNTVMRRQGFARSNTPAAIDEIGERLARAEAKDTPSSKRVATALRRERAGLETVSPLLVDKPMTLQSASRNRVSLARAGASRAARDAAQGFAGGSPTRAAGAGWYFDHRGDLNKVAAEHGMDERTVAIASAVMSPRNSPLNEKEAVAGLAHLHRHDPTLSFSPTAQRELKVGPSARFSELTEEQAGKVGTASLRQHITGVDSSILEKVAKGGPQVNVSKAVGIIRGTTNLDDAINPHSAPKVWSYADSIMKSQPGTREHSEYMERANQLLFETPGQERLDLFGLKDSKEGILSPTKTTAEDTWQMAVSNGQQLESINAGRHNLSPAKVISSSNAYNDLYKPKKQYSDDKGVTQTIHPDSRIGSTAITHAWHNQATVGAAKSMSKESGVIVPAVLAQEVPWVESRRVADKDDTTGWTEWSEKNAAEKRSRLSPHQFPEGGVFNPKRKMTDRQRTSMAQTDLTPRGEDGKTAKDPNFVQDSLF